MQRDGEGQAAIAYSLYRRAAETGMPAAEFNVGVMLDSGRGVRTDIAKAATWYARAAAHGHSRAAYNLGQLYEAGEGVPKNMDLARAWLTASSVAAARDRLADLPGKGPRASMPLRAPQPVAPADGTRSDPRIGGVEFVWTSPEQSEPVRYYLELRALNASGSREVFASFADRSSVFAEMALAEGSYAWRVITVSREAGGYAASDWTRFDIRPAASVSGER